MQRGRSSVSVGQLIEAGHLTAGQELRYRQHSDATATLVDSGAIDFRGTVYPSPSAAARAANYGISTNGWLAWFVNRDGRWIPLARLREHIGKGADTQGS